LPTFTNTAKYALRWLTGSNIGSDIDAGFQTLAEDLDSKMVGYGQGALADMPAAGKQGRIWRATTFAQTYFYYDTGSAWELINSIPGYQMLGSTGDTGQLGSGYQAVPGLTAIMPMTKGQLATLDASITIEVSTNDSVMAFWAVNGTGGAMLTGAARTGRAGRVPAAAGALYQAPADGSYTFTVYATNPLGGGIVRGAAGESWARIVIR
jgi:hypothetical protein